MRPPYCMICKNKNDNDITLKHSLLWCSDYDASDLGFDLDGIVGIYCCPNDECQIVYEIMDFFIDENTEQRVVKYSYITEDEDAEPKKEEGMVSNCLYCSNELKVEEVKATTDVYGTEFECNGITTILKCPHCETNYDVVDLYPVEDLYKDIDLEIRDSRTIFIR